MTKAERDQITEFVTGQSPEGPFYAYCERRGAEQGTGWGSTPEEAKADLREKLEVQP